MQHAADETLKPVVGQCTRGEPIRAVRAAYRVVMSSASADDPIQAAIRSVEGIRRWARAGEVAPHKPLLLLLALSRVKEGAPRFVDFNDIEQPLRDLIQQFGTPRSHVHPEYPFWRLQNDKLWEVVDAASFPTRKSNTDAPISALRARHAQGGLPELLDKALRKDPEGLRRLADAVASRFFPGDERTVLQATGLT